jgi:hypothetical protein
MIDGEQLDTAGPNQVSATIAQSRNVDLTRLLQCDDSGGAHASSGGLILAFVNDGPIGLGKGFDHGDAGIFVCGQSIVDHAGNDFGGHAAGTFAHLLAAHAVGNEKQLVVLVDDEAVFVVRPQPLG